MSFSEEQFTSKLNALDETQESIVNASKWLLTQYKEVDQIAHCWKRFVIRPSINTRRKFLAIYLANDVIQQAKHKRVGDFGTAFGKIMPEVLSEVYPELNQEMRRKVKRVVDIWKQRQVFSEPVIEMVYSKLREPSKGASRIEEAPSAKIAPELRQLASIFDQLTKSQGGISSTKTKFDSSLEALDPNSAVYSENYKTVQRIGQVAKDALQKSMVNRQQAIKELQKLLDFQNEQASQDQFMVGEIDEVLAAKDPQNSNPNGSLEAAMMPTYEETDESDSDAEKSDIEEQGKKRLPSTAGIENDNFKRQKSIISDAGAENLETIEAELYEPTPAEVAANSPVTVTSSIQDLLSKLAN
ncbi:LADA_0E07206g1_1 [Lachancea dasiensis]|uniref:LADA_0E07206g1_1 n=1 Tax=Lachancea dasiensis TaxID=1072105 RepID=A0A1G4JCU1_9SACH|nr:LADA_0E07206g1_1 [Lachancea dasiensis]